MKSTPDIVRVVVDRSFGERLAALPPSQPVWIVDSPLNTPVASRLWQERPTETHLSGITTFKPAASGSAEAELLAQLQTIDLHHGEYSADPPYSALEVFGCAPSGSVSAALREIGFAVHSTTRDGFIAGRTQKA